MVVEQGPDTFKAESKRLTSTSLQEDNHLSQNKLAYAYLLTPTGITEKAGLTVRFLACKVAEYESLTLEIEALKSEMSKVQSNPASIHD